MVNRKTLLVALLAVTALALSACARPPSAMPGFITLGVTEFETLGSDGTLGSKTGTACTKSILGWLTSGDSGIKAAAANGGISTVKAVDYKSKSLLGITGEHCTIAYGN